MARFVTQARLTANASDFGSAVALSADGGTAIVGAPWDGSAWVYVLADGTWTLQAKLVGSDAIGGWQGYSVAISADGNTALVGAPYDAGDIGAARVFTRSAGQWTQQGPKLLGGTRSGNTELQGYAVALSADGNTALIGSPARSGAWVFTRGGETWSQQGALLAGDSGPGEQGSSVALSAAGNTAVLGGPKDASSVGAAWVFTRTGSSWAQQGAKLVGSDYAGAAQQGTSVALAADGSTLLVGAPGNGAVWVYSLVSGTWTQRGAKLTLAPLTGTGFGTSVSLCGDGTLAAIGAPYDHTWAGGGSGTTWVYRLDGGGRSLPLHNLYGVSAMGKAVTIAADCRTVIGGSPGSASAHVFSSVLGSPVYWHHDTGLNAVWQFSGGGASVASTRFLPGLDPDVEWSGALADVNNDSIPDVVWQGSNNEVWVWLMSAAGGIAQVTKAADLAGPGWKLAGAGWLDFTSWPSLVWRNASDGRLDVWDMAADGSIAGVRHYGVVPLEWELIGVGDVDQSTLDDLVWFRRADGAVALWLKNWNASGFTAVFPGSGGPGWRPYRVARISSPFGSDIWWRNELDGTNAAWYMQGGAIADVDFFVAAPPAQWTLADVGDFNIDGRGDLVWYAPGEGGVVRWSLHGPHASPTYDVLPGVGPGWHVLPWLGPEW